MKKYNVTRHAIERAYERLGIAKEQAAGYLNQLMQTAFYNGVTSSFKGDSHKVFDHHRTRTRIIVSEDGAIITVYKVPEGLTVDIPSFLRPVIDREFRKVKREVIRNTRRHELAIAQLTVEMGERMTAKARARNPKTRELIQRDIDDIQAKIEAKQASITREQDRLENFVRATGVFS